MNCAFRPSCSFDASVGPSKAFELAVENDWPSLEMYVKELPTLARYVDSEFRGYTPLHLACVYGAPLSTVRVLIEAYPEGASVTDSKGWIPLHCACGANAPEDVLELLAMVYPEGVKVRKTPDRASLYPEKYPVK